MGTMPQRTRTPVRLIEVAQEARVGTSVVSRVLNGDPSLNVRDETRQRILDAAARLDYRPNALARGLKLARTMTIGLVIPLGYSENAELIAAIERAAADRGYLTLLADAAEFVGHGESYRRLLLERRVDGLLMASGLGEDAFLRGLRDHGVPLLVVNRRLDDGVPSASMDDERGMSVAVDHLIGLGHRRIGYIGGPQTSDISRRRLAGYRTAMRAAQLRVQARYVEESSEHEVGGFEGMQELLRESPAPTAVAVWSVTSAIGALAAARRAGLTVPADVSVIAFHDAPVAQYLEPPLTTVRMPMTAMGNAAVKAVIALAEGKRVADTIVRRPGPALVKRASTARPPD
jgi:LacI family transcriptional regulator